MLVRRRHHLVRGTEVEPGEDDVAAVGGRRRQRDVLDVDVYERGNLAAKLLAEREDPLKLRDASSPVAEPALLLLVHRVDRCTGERANAS